MRGDDGDAAGGAVREDRPDAAQPVRRRRGREWEGREALNFIHVFIYS